MSYSHSLPQLEMQSTVGLKDYPFEAYVTYLFGSDYDQGIVLLMNRLNKEAGPSCWIDLTGNCYRTAEVRKVVQAYMNLVLAGDLPEYDRANNAGAIESIEQAVMRASGISEGRTKAILYYLYVATIEGDLKTDILLRPQSSQRYNRYRTTPDTVESFGTESPLEQLKPWLIGGLVVAGLFSVAKIATAVKEVVD